MKGTVPITRSEPAGNPNYSIAIGYLRAVIIVVVVAVHSVHYSHSLQGESKTRAIVFRKVEGHEFDAIAVPAGEHILRVRIQSAADAYDQSKTIPDAFIRSTESRLRIVCGKKPGQLQLILH